MKNLTVTIKGQYESSNSIFTGTKKQALNYLRSEAAKMRRDSRVVRNLPDNVFSIDEDLHPSKLVTMASFKLNNLGLESLLNLMNNHGLIKYTIE